MYSKLSSVMSKKIKPGYFFILIFFCNIQTTAQSVSLAGQWSYRLDSLDVGIRQGWFNQLFEKNIQLPGTLDDAGVGKPPLLTDDSLNKEVLLMLTRKHSYVGAAWYRKEIFIPLSWKQKHIELFLERIIWKTEIWVDGKEAGSGESLIAPHRFDLSALLKPGKHWIVIRIDNSKQYEISTRDMAHAYTDGTQIMWNGIIGKMQLIARDKLYMDNVQVYPDIQNKTARIVVSLQNKSESAREAVLQLKANGKNNMPAVMQKLSLKVPLGKSEKEITISLGNKTLLWDEFNRNLYTLTVNLTSENPGMRDKVSTAFGMRSVTNENSMLQVNGRRIFLRGTLECNIFPLTGHPPMDKKGWLKVFNTAKAYGLNHLRFHSWCPPEAAFDVADSLGFYLLVELPFWNKNAGKDDKMDLFLEEEAKLVSREYGNHASFCFWSLGNELEGDFIWLAKLLKELKRSDPRHLYTSTTFTFQKDHGRWPEPGDDYFITQYTKKGWVRGQGIFNTYAPDFITDYTKAIDSVPIPVITHEIGQYSVYPNLEEIKKYSGVLDPLNFKAIRKDLERKGLLQLAPQFTLASGKFSANLYKEEIERALKTRGLSGFELLDLHDFPGQGTASIGILDAFWDSKGLVTPEAHRMYCSAIVPLLRFKKATYTNAEQFTAEAELANFSNGSLNNITPSWTAKDQSGKIIASGSLAKQTVGTGNGIELGSISFDLRNIRSADVITIELGLRGTDHKNSWKIWVYPEMQNEITDSDIVFTGSLQDALQYLQQGKKVLLNPDTANINGVQGRFAPVFWSPVHFPNQPGTMGILCDPKHPGLQNFPTQQYSDWQWWDLITSSKTMVIDSLPSLIPIVRVIDNFFKNRKMANLIEVKLGTGKLLLSSVDINHALDKRHSARQLRYSLEQYMNSKAFDPSVEITEKQLKYLLK